MPSLQRIGKDKVINHHHDVPFRVLEKQYSFGDEGAENMIIHGDNLEGLKSLLPQYEGKVKCIYIDPPYNTGNEGRVYNDNMNHPKIKKWLKSIVGKEGEDFNRHDKWLCMMYPRLKLLHKLLRDDGVIFISIDDNEQANLKLIMDEIFGGNNFISNITRFKRVSPANDAKHISSDHEYITIYAKQPSKFPIKRLERNQKQESYYKNIDNDPRGARNSAAYTCNKSAEERPNLYYSIINPNTGEEIWPKKTAVWAYSYETHLQNIEQNLLFRGKDGKSKSPRKKRFLTEAGDVIPRSIRLSSDVGSTQTASGELLKLFPEKGFITPKPLELVNRILKLSTDKDSIILDSFAGSGTTAHAVLNLNKQDGGDRKFILLELMEYADTITAERVKRAIKGYGEGIKPTEGTGGGFGYYTLGQALFDEEDNLNESIDIETIKQYIRYTETKTTYVPQSKNYFLGRHKTTDYYFYYEHDKATVLDLDFLFSLPESSDYRLIYADVCHLSSSFLTKHKIIFKKIPRDITRF